MNWGMAIFLAFVIGLPLWLVAGALWLLVVVLDSSADTRRQQRNPWQALARPVVGERINWN